MDGTTGGEYVLGISTCLTGAAVRYDGGHKLDRHLLDLLEPRARLVPICPEAEAGFGVPRQPVDLHGAPAEPKVVGVETGENLTFRLRRWAMETLEQRGAELQGFVFRRKSPSCAVGSVPVYGENGEVITTEGVGLFARMFSERYPLRPIVEGHELRTGQDLERYLARVRLGRDWRATDAERQQVERYHRARRAVLSAADPNAARAMDELLKNAGLEPAEQHHRYERLLASILRHPALQ